MSSPMLIEQIARLPYADVWLAAACVGLIAGWLGCALLWRRLVRVSRSRDASEDAHAVSGQGTVLLDGLGEVVDANAKARELLWPALAPEALPRLAGSLRQLTADPTSQRRLVRIGETRQLEVALSPMIGRTKNESLRALVVRDITRRRRGQQRLVQLAHYDSLTGLGNRRLFVDRLDRVVSAVKGSGPGVALLYMDLDRFKTVNDSYGHDVGDLMLKSVAERMTGVVRDHDGGPAQSGSIVFRLSGDEFAIIVPNVRTRGSLELLASNLVAAVSEPLETASETLFPSSSIGIALYPDDAHDAESLVKHADTALYSAKDRGRGRFAFFDPEYRAEADRSNRIERELRSAIERGEFVLHYQPKVEIAEDSVVGFEALIRWYSRELGFVGPKEFIPIAERSGLILDIGEWTLHETCRQIRFWQDAGFATVPVSVNVSGAQFRDTEVDRVVAAALMEHSVHPSMIEIEITESLLVEDDHRISTTLRDLRAIGVRVCLDDFGTGYSALTYLNRFPLDVVKMDRGFIRDIEDSSSAEEIAAAVVSLSHSLGFEVVAEGVDSPVQAALLRRMECDQIQGFLFSPAVPGEEATQYLAGEGLVRPKVKTIFGPSSRFLEEQIEERDNEIASEGDDPNQPMKVVASTAPPRILVIDTVPSQLGTTAFRWTQLDADVHLVTELDEARLFVEHEEPVIDLVVALPDIELDGLRSLMELLEKSGDGVVPRSLICGPEPTPERRDAIRAAGIDYVLGEPFGDPELRFFVNAARSSRSWQSQRQTVRVPVEQIAWIRAGAQRAGGVVTSLSRRGAQIETSGDFEVGQPVRVEFRLDAMTVSVFANVTRVEEPVEEGAERAPGSISTIFYEVDDMTDATISDYVEQVWLSFRA